MRFFRIFLFLITVCSVCSAGELRLIDATGGAPMGFLLQSSLALAAEGQMTVSMRRALPSEALKSLDNGKVDAVIVDRKFAGKRQSIPLAAEALVLYVSGSNPVTGLSVQEVKDILYSAVPQWKKYNQMPLDIQRIMMKFSSPSATLIRRIFGGKELPEDIFQVDSLSSGFSFINLATLFFAPFSSQGFSVQVKMLPVNGVEPTTVTVADGRYPLSRQYVMVFRQKTPELQKLLRETVRPEYRRIISISGLISLLPDNFTEGK